MPGNVPFVTVIGGANIDIHGKPEDALRANDSNPGTVYAATGGVARNIAENLARLGVDSRLISVIGDDPHGQMLMRLSREAGIDMRYVHEIDGVATSTYLSVLDDAGDMQVAISDMRITDHLDADRLRPQQAMLAQSAIIIVDTNLPGDALSWLADTFADTPIFADTVSTTKASRLIPCLDAIHTLKTSSIEVEALTGRLAQSESQLRNVAAWLHDKGVNRVFITQGEAGVFYSADALQGFEKLPRTATEMHNSGGAGDAFLAALAYAWLENRSLAKTLQIALLAAEITLTDPATCSPALSPEAINRALEAARAG